VAGTVTFQDQPVPEGSTVMFQSKEGKSYIATGAVKAGGKYELMYNGKPEIPGMAYLVQITPPPAAAAPVSTVDAANAGAVATKKVAAAAKGIKLPFPEKYAAAATSQLTYEVKAGENTADFKLAP